MQDDALLAFQIAFDLIENEHQAFLLNVRNRLPDSKSRASSRINLEQPSQSVEHETSGIDSAQNGNAVAGSANVAGSVEDVQMTDGAHAPNGAVQEMNPNEVAYAEKLAKIKGILSGETSRRLTLQFLYSHNRSGNSLFNEIIEFLIFQITSNLMGFPPKCCLSFHSC